MTFVTSGILGLITDFGQKDHYVGVMKAVVLTRSPAARIVDISHEVPPCSIAGASYLLGQSYPYFPDRSLFLVVVDPGVGTARRIVLLETDAALFLGPDNGVFSAVLARETLRGSWAARDVTTPVSATFHGRDVFAPLAGGILAGDGLQDTFEPWTPEPRPESVRPERDRGGPAVGEIVWIDRFGNLVTSLRPENLGFELNPSLRGVLGSHRIMGHRRVYAGGSLTDPYFITGSGGYLEISLTGGDAARRLGAAIGSRIEVRPS